MQRAEGADTTRVEPHERYALLAALGLLLLLLDVALTHGGAAGAWPGARAASSAGRRAGRRDAQ
jgi:hypothetical protein